MKQNLHVASSPLTGTIFCGKVLKDGCWAAGKLDVTIESLIAVANHALHFKNQTGEDVIISKLDGTPEFKIKVEKL